MDWQRSKKRAMKWGECKFYGNVIVSSEKVASSMFFKYNSALGPPYHIIVDTNFINFSVQNKLELIKTMMDCLFAKCETAHLISSRRYSLCDRLCAGRVGKVGFEVSNCVAVRTTFSPLTFRVARDPRFERLPCSHAGTYADDCIVNRVTQVIDVFDG